MPYLPTYPLPFTLTMTTCFVEVDHIDRVFDLPNGKTYIALSTLR